MCVTVTNRVIKNNYLEDTNLNNVKLTTGNSNGWLPHVTWNNNIEFCCLFVDRKVDFRKTVEHQAIYISNPLMNDNQTIMLV